MCVCADAAWLANTCGMSQRAVVVTYTIKGCSGVAAQDYKNFLNDSSLVPVLTEVFQIGPNPGVMAHAVRERLATFAFRLSLYKPILHAVPAAAFEHPSMATTQ